MSHLARTCLALFCLIALAALAQAQTPSPKDAPAAKNSSTKKASAARAGADPLAEQRRLTAISLLSSLADEAKGYHDQVLSARVLARAADALWESDTERARSLFRRAWEAAESADAESARRLEEDINNQKILTGSAAATSPPNLRNEVLRLAASHDRTLGEEFLKKLEEAREREAANKSLKRDPWATSQSQSQRLKLAAQLLQDGDVDRALQYADPALDSVNPDTINFLSALRQKKAQAADERFAAILTRAGADPASDANTVSGLSSYAFTPFFYVSFLPNGGANQMQRREATPAPDLPADLRKAFFLTAARILLRPSPPAGQDTTSAGRTGKYMVIKRLLPLFDQYEPERAAELRVQMAALTPDVPEKDRTGENRALTRGIVPEENSRDTMQVMQERLDQAADAAERDAIYADTAASIAGSGDTRARDLVDKIADTELRQQTRAYTDFEFLDNALQKKDAQEAIRISHNGELTHIQRVWGLTQAARLLMKTDRSRAVELLEEATTEARRIGGSEAERPRALIAVVTGFAEADRSRAWELISEAIKAGNSAEGFTGDDARMTTMLRSKFMVMLKNSNVSDFDLRGVFRVLAKDDLYRAIEIAKNFTSEAARANATLAIASAVLEEKQK